LSLLSSTVSQSIDGWLDYKRISVDIESLEQAIEQGELEIKNLQRNLDEAVQDAHESGTENTELLQLLDTARRLRDDANKIFDKQEQVSSKRDELSIIAPSAAGKDLRTLENEVSSKIEQKDSLMSTISSLNKEASDLNNQISRLSNQASQAEKLVRDKEEKFAKEQEAITKKQQLNDAIANCNEEEKKVRLNFCSFC